MSFCSAFLKWVTGRIFKSEHHVISKVLKKEENSVQRHGDVKEGEGEPGRHAWALSGRQEGRRRQKEGGGGRVKRPPQPPTRSWPMPSWGHGSHGERVRVLTEPHCALFWLLGGEGELPAP